MPRDRERARRVVQPHGDLAVATREDHSHTLRALSRPEWRLAYPMLGLAMTRYLWRLEQIAPLPDDDVVTYLAPTIQRYLTADLRPPHPP